MSTTTDLQRLSQSLADIEPPPAVDWSLWLWLSAGVVLVLILAVVLWLRLRPGKSVAAIAPPQAALQELTTLKQDLSDTRQSAYRLAALLRRGLSLDVQTQALPSHIDSRDWRELQAKLQQLRYQANCPLQIDEDDLTRVEQWLRGTPC